MLMLELIKTLFEYICTVRYLHIKYAFYNENQLVFKSYFDVPVPYIAEFHI